jgi:putative pyruvate formate lyase activating enzyme
LRILFVKSYFCRKTICPLQELDHCMICPRSCRVNRNAGLVGYCGTDAGYQVASVCLHRGEEPPISGPNGICNVFFAGCNLHCVYCQNYQISQRPGRVRNTTSTLEEVTQSIIAILDQGIEAVGFVTPTHFTPQVKAIIRRLNTLGYHPITVYNTSGYDRAEVLREFEELIDVYLPDFKYLDPSIARRFSDAADYPDHVRQSIREMYRQKGSNVVLNDAGMAVTGLIIRHLVLPGQVNDSIRILQWIASELSNRVSLSLMSQYYPTYGVSDHPVLGRRITTAEYQQVLKAFEDLGFTSGWIQHPESADSYTPDFRLENPFGNT